MKARKMGFKEIKRRLLGSLRDGTYQHEARWGIETKNLLQSGSVSPTRVMEIVSRCGGTHHQSSPHHVAPGIQVHVLRRDGWYIKFYFVDPDTVFISVHQ